MADPDPLQTAMLHGASRALRRRARRQEKLAESGTATEEGGAIIRTGEAVLAIRLASVFSQIAAEFEGEAP
jgi:hypothetical protein